MLVEKKAIYYGEVELIPGIVCDGYVLNDESKTAVMSERGAANLLGMDQKTLEAVRGNWPPKTLKSFIDNDLIVRGNYIEVDTIQSPHHGRKICMYTVEAIECIIRSYALAYINGSLRKNQHHIGKRNANLCVTLMRTALETAIREACGFTPQIQKTTQKHYTAVELLKEHGFSCSLTTDNIATKYDISSFLKVPECTLNSYLRKHRLGINPIKLSKDKINLLGSKASQMNGYSLEDVAKIAFGMDTEIGIELKRKMFGSIGSFATPEIKDEVQWRKILSRVFKNFGLQYNYSIGSGSYRVDFFVPTMGLCLECNGYSHRYYDKKEEKKREKFILEHYALVRFHHQISLEALFNGILKAKQGKICYVYDKEDIKLPLIEPQSTN